jgi:hypothetical protein
MVRVKVEVEVKAMVEVKEDLHDDGIAAEANLRDAVWKSQHEGEGEGESHVLFEDLHDDGIAAEANLRDAVWSDLGEESRYVPSQTFCFAITTLIHVVIVQVDGT